MAHKLHFDEYPEVRAKFADWDRETKTKATGLLTAITTFEFICNFMIAYKYLSHLAGVTVQLQSTLLDILDAHMMVNGCYKLFIQISSKKSLVIFAISLKYNLLFICTCTHWSA